MTRRDLLRSAGMTAGSLALAPLVPGFFARPAAWQQAAAADPVAAMRAQMAQAPITSTPLGERLVMLSGPGGNVAVLHGTDGKVLVDGFVLPAWSDLQKALAGLDRSPLKVLIDTHWHFDHADNNGNFRSAGGSVVAHENTKKRMSQSHDLLGMRFEPSPAGALPTETFAKEHTLSANGETLALAYVQPAHTDTDIAIHFRKANVLHLGDLFFNGMYPFIDAGTGGSIGGMIASADRALGMVDAQTKIVPGHGPLADKAALTKFRDMMVTVRDRVQKLKSSGRTLEAVVKEKPTADLDAVWGQGFLQPDQFVGIVYGTI